MTSNPVLDIEQYPLPKPEDLFATLAGGKQFTKIDLTNAYLQLPLNEQSKKLCTVNTHKGLFQYTRMPFGVAFSSCYVPEADGYGVARGATSGLLYR